MTTYKELQVQIAQLQKQAEEVRKTELSSAIAEIRAKIQEYGVTAADLGLSGNKKTVKVKPAVEAKYRNPTTGDTWSGRGKAPKWIADQNRDQF